MHIEEFAAMLHAVPELRTMRDRATALLWFAGREVPSVGLTPREVAEALERGGYPRQNISRLREQLAEDRRTAKAGGDAFRLRPSARSELDSLLASLVGPRRAGASDSVIPRELIERTRRDYLRRVVHQVNASYDYELWDCCAVMLRRLIETLIIEVFESVRANESIKASSGHFFMLDDLLKALLRENQRFHLGRNSHRGLAELKELGDKSAHNRRFNATRADIDRLRADIRTAVDELVNLAELGWNSARRTTNGAA